MPHTFRSVALVSLTTICANSVTAQSVIVWDMSTTAPSSGAPVTNLTISALSRVNGGGSTLLNSSSASTGYAGASGGNNAQAAPQAGALNLGTSTYFQVTLTPDTGFNVQLNSLTFGSRSIATTGPSLISVYTSADSFASAAYSTTVPTNGTWTQVTTGGLTSVVGTALAPLVLRVYGSGSGGSPGAGSWRIDDVTLTATVSAVPEPSTYAAIAGAAAFVTAICRRRRKPRPASLRVT